MSKSIWRLWIRHMRGGGWRQTREGCWRKTRKEADRWADLTADKYKLHAMAYCVALPGETPLDAPRRVEDTADVEL